MIIEGSEIKLKTVAEADGWTIKPHGACRGDACVPLPPGADGRDLAERLGMAVLRDEQSDLSVLGPASGGTVLSVTDVPDLTLRDRHGEPFSLRSLKGTRHVIVSWAPWCLCRMDLPVWAELRSELIRSGVELVTVALDSAGEAGAFLDSIQPDHPSLIDTNLDLVAGLGFVNVPMAVWVDEEGHIVRPAEPAWPGRAVFYETDSQAAVRDAIEGADGGRLDAWVDDMLVAAGQIATDADSYVASLRDWAAKGDQSRFVLTDSEVMDRSGQRSPGESEAAARFELAVRLKRDGRTEDARAQLRIVHQLDPDNWSYKRQAWSNEDPLQRPTGHYESDFVTDIRRVGAANYYRPSVGVTESGDHKSLPR